MDLLQELTNVRSNVELLQSGIAMAKAMYAETEQRGLDTLTISLVSKRQTLELKAFPFWGTKGTALLGSFLVDYMFLMELELDHQNAELSRLQRKAARQAGKNKTL